MELVYGDLEDFEPGIAFENADPREVAFSGKAVVRDGELVISALSIVERTPLEGAGVRSGDLRNVRIGEIKIRIADDLRREPTLLTPVVDVPGLLAKGAQSPDLLTSKEGLWLAYLRGALRMGHNAQELTTGQLAFAGKLAGSIGTSSPKRGRGAQSDSFYRQVAIQYMRVLENHPNRVIEELTKELRATREDPDLPRDTVSSWVRRSRETGWLTPSTQGKAGGDAGPKLINWIHEQEVSLET